MVSGYMISVIDHIKSMHLIFPADVEALYLDHLHEVKRQTSWAFVVGFFFPL
ncbi:Cpr, partial [Symbiodinium sp. CCMP2592]